MSTSIEPIDRSKRPVFEQPWWLDEVAKTPRYGEAQVIDGNIQIGSLPYIRGRLLGVCSGIMPWTHLSGPALSPSLSERDKVRVLVELINQISPHISVTFVQEQGKPDAPLIREAFTTAKIGFTTRLRPTFLQYPDDQDVMDRMSSNDRYAARNAAKKLEVVEIGADEFIRVYGENLKRDGKQSYAPLNIAHGLIARGLERDPGSSAPRMHVFAAREKEEDNTGVRRIHAALALPRDHERMYACWVTLDHNGHRAANKLLFVHAMQLAKREGIIFDADGTPSDNHVQLYQLKLAIPHQVMRETFEHHSLVGQFIRPHKDKVASIRQRLRQARTNAHALGTSTQSLLRHLIK